MPNPPNRPQPNQHEIEALRQRQHMQQPQQAQRTAEDDVPHGTVWQPNAEDLKPVRKPAELEVPGFIPLRLDAPANEAQRQTSETVRQGSTTQRQPDYDPAVDEGGDVYVGPAALKSSPSLVLDQTGRPVQTTGRQKNPEVTEHPVLLRLRESFGLKSVPTKSETIGGIKFTFRKYTNQAYAKFVINRVRGESVETQAEFDTKHGYAIAAIGIAAINDVPTHEVFGVEIDPTLEAPLLVNDPMHPPTSVIVNTAEMLYPWLLGLSIPELGDALAIAYGKLFPEQVLLAAKGTWKYACPKDNCTETQERLPRYNASGEMKRVYCPVHGVPMRALGSLEELANIPLA